MDQQGNTTPHSFNPTQGEKLCELLDEAKTYLISNNSHRADNALEIFIKAMPEDGEASSSLRTRLDQLYNWYTPIKKQLDHITQHGRLLERHDAEETKPLLHLEFVSKKYTICRVIYYRYRLYEHNSIIDYDL